MDMSQHTQTANDSAGRGHETSAESVDERQRDREGERGRERRTRLLLERQRSSLRSTRAQVNCEGCNRYAESLFFFLLFISFSLYFFRTPLPLPK